MGPFCKQCHEIVVEPGRTCTACGADLTAPVAAGEVIDLSERADLDERLRLQLLEALAGPAEVTRRPRPRFDDGRPTRFELELAPVRIGRFPSPDDVLPAPAAKRSWRHR
jgi:hypothetical protein